MKEVGSVSISLLLGVLLVISAAFSPATAETLTINVRDGQTGDAMEGAFVMVGFRAGLPFDGNFGWTDEDGTVVFDDPLLASPQTVTAGAEDFGFITLCEAAQGELDLVLYPAVLDTTMGGTRSQVEGDVTNISIQNNDGNFDIAVILPAMATSSYALLDMLPFVAVLEEVIFPVIGPIEMPSNTYMPDQIEFFFFHFEKSPYRIDVSGGRNTTFVSTSARVSIDDILGGTAFESAVVREIGVERDVFIPLPGAEPFELDIDSDLDLVRELTIQFEDVPDDAQVQCVSVALIESEGMELAVGYDTRGDMELRAGEFVLSTMAPAGDLSDATNAAIGTYMDSSAALDYSVGIFDRSGFVPPYTAVFDSWMLVPELEQSQFDFGWDDPTNPGVSPSPIWTRSSLGLRAIDPEDTTVTRTVNWRIYAQAEPGYFRLPLLPDVAPGPYGGLPDPDETPDEDQLYWEFVAANPPGDLPVVLADFMQGGTHWASRWIPIVIDYSGVEADAATWALRIDLGAAPSPSATEVRFAWQSSLTGRGVLELTGPQGRLVRRYEVSLARNEIVWRGQDARGRRVPGGLYWACLRSGETVLGQQRLIWLR
jgi:hypothetical protein